MYFGLDSSIAFPINFLLINWHWHYIFKKMIINLQIWQFIIDNCNMTTSIIYTSIYFKINRIVKFYHIVTISIYIVITTSFKQNIELSIERNYSFQSHIISFNFEIKNNILTHIVDFKTSIIQVKNVIDKTIIVSKHTKLNKIIDFDEKNCYHVDVINVRLIVDINWNRRVLTTIIDLIMMTTSLLFDLIDLSKSFSNIQFIMLQIHVTTSISLFEIIISFDIIIYDISLNVQQRLQNIAKFFFNIWKNNDDIVNVFEKNWISIKIIFDVKSKFSRVYFVDSQNREFIMKIWFFNKNAFFQF